ncbi:conserved hypothetical protein [Exiguobacterium sp. 8H]|uniref:hypothetical protein n=1 Tax=unclassified Exiguobacterium TaxID=2644629 RepID=UPI0012EF506C|nr:MULTISPECIES: hypothetical protein [unclassified Exiguobacterium]VXB32802.1 conserved hypothetical protein [Exiguobacterium sp. 8H]VXB34202.1 conserved hypothetical protein [Exiguobacterium sp. 8A]
MNVLQVDPKRYDVWNAFPTYFLEQSPVYVNGSVTTPTAFIEVIGHGIVAEAEVLLEEMIGRPDDPYWLGEKQEVVQLYSLVDLLQLHFHHPLLQVGMYEVDEPYESIRKKWNDGYYVPSSKWTKESYEAHLFREKLLAPKSHVTTCASCHVDLAERFGKEAYHLIEYHLTEERGIWVCPTCHKAIHTLD